MWVQVNHSLVVPEGLRQVCVHPHVWFPYNFDPYLFGLSNVPGAGLMGGAPFSLVPTDRLAASLLALLQTRKAGCASLARHVWFAGFTLGPNMTCAHNKALPTERKGWDPIEWAGGVAHKRGSLAFVKTLKLQF